MAEARKYRQTAERIHTRELDRKIARERMKKLGVQHPAKHSYSHGLSLSGKDGAITRHESYFSEHWRDCI